MKKQAIYRVKSGCRLFSLSYDKHKKQCQEYGGKNAENADPFCVDLDGLWLPMKHGHIKTIRGKCPVHAVHVQNHRT